MMRPRSIVWFERLYLSGLLLSLAGWALSWPALERRLLVDPRTAAYPSLWYVLPLAMLLGAALTLLLWWLVARRASRVGKWLVVAFATLAGVRLAFNLPVLLGGRVAIAQVLLAFATTGLSIAAAAFLFADDARAWFGEDAASEERA